MPGAGCDCLGNGGRGLAFSRRVSAAFPAFVLVRAFDLAPRARVDFLVVLVATSPHPIVGIQTFTRQAEAFPAQTMGRAHLFR